MTKIYTQPSETLSINLSAFDILGVNEADTDDIIRQSYLKLVRENPPERDQAQFQKIRNAYEQISTEENRIKYMLFDAPMVGILELIKNTTKSNQQAKQPNEVLLKAILTEQMNERN